MTQAAQLGRPLRCLILADDLTGACDAAVHFAERGLRTETILSPGETWLGETAEVVAVNTQSRCAAEEAARRRVRAAFESLAQRRYDFLFKKVDSNLRGNVSAEISAAWGAAGCEVILMSPALPALGKLVKDGKIQSPSGEGDVASAVDPLRSITVSTCELSCPKALLVRLRRAMRESFDVILFDAASDSDLERMVAIGLDLSSCPLWVGSAGLAAALAKTIPASNPRKFHNRSHRPVLMGVGSDHPMTVVQVSQCRASAGMVEMTADSLSPEAVRQAMETQSDVLLHLPRGAVRPEHIRSFARMAPLSGFGGMILSGGDTAAHFLQALGAHSLELRSEVLPGIPCSEIHGGIADGMPLITKSGAFGQIDALSACVRYFRSPGTSPIDRGSGQ